MWCSDDSSQPASARAALVCFGAGLVFLLITHFPYLGLPYHWDELGHFVPAAHDLLASGALVPRSTAPNVHPPLLMAYLVGAWKLFGFAIPVTRAAMLVVAAAAMSAAFVLGCRLANRRAAGAAAALMAVSPPFVAQSMMAHLDLPATLGVLLSIHFFLERRWWLCGAAATALALTKETGVIVPAVLLAFNRGEKRRLAPLLLPFVALGGWLLLLRSQTGYWLGDAEFARYNVAEALRLWRIPLVLARRLYQLGGANFHWVATAALAVAVLRCGALKGVAWRLVGTIMAAYLVLHSVAGGAILLRYLLPAMALFYLATGAALEALPARLRRAGLTVMLAGLAVSNWWNPPYPFGYEDNLAVTDFIRLQQQAAGWLSEHAAGRTITTAWPLTDALSNPLLGYVERPLRVAAVENFQPQAWQGVDPAKLELVAIYSRSWEPPRGWQKWPPAAGVLQKYFGYVPQLPRREWAARFHLESLAHWERRGQWMEIFAACNPALPCGIR